MSSWLTEVGESSSTDPGLTIPRGLSAVTTDAAMVTGLYFPSGVKLWMEYLYSKYTKLEVVAVIMAKVQYEDNRQHINIVTAISRFSLFICCNVILFCIYSNIIILNILAFWFWLSNLLEGMKRCIYVLYCVHTSPVLLLSLMLLLAGRGCLNLYFRVIIILESWLLYILFVHLPQKLLDPHKRYPESFSFTEYSFCLQLALSDFEEGHEGSPITVYRGVKLSYYIVLILHCCVPIIISLMLTWKCILYLEFLLAIDSLIIYVLHTLLCAMISKYIISN